MRGVDVVWVVRDDYMASHFIDAGAAEFLADAVRGAESDGRTPPPPTPAPARTLRYAVADAGRGAGAGTHGCALGPNWHRSLHLAGSAADCRRVRFFCKTQSFFAFPLPFPLPFPPSFPLPFPLPHPFPLPTGQSTPDSDFLNRYLSVIDATVIGRLGTRP